MKRTLLFVLVLLLAWAPADAAKKVSILGDSYSAFASSIPEGNAWWYSDEGAQGANDVSKLSEMWWQVFIAQHKYKLEVNNAYSGSTVCNTGYGGRDYTAISFIARMSNLGNPDIILILGGTNDSWAGAPIGPYKYEGQTAQDLKAFRPAFAYMLGYLKQNHPKAEIVNIVNNGLSEEVTSSMDSICRYYKVKNVLLKEIDKQTNHPSVAGMKAIAEQVSAARKK